MEFDEVSHFVKHGKIGQASSIDERNIDALGVASPYYYHQQPNSHSPPHFAPFAQPIALKKRPIAAKFVDSVRHRLLKSSTTGTVSSDEDDIMMARHVGRKRLFSRLKKRRSPTPHAIITTGSNCSSGDDDEALVDGYLSLDDVCPSSSTNRRSLWRRRRRQRRRIRRRLLFSSSSRAGQEDEPDIASTPTSTVSDLREINDQMRSFCVPADWANLDQTSPLHSPNIAGTPAFFEKPTSVHALMTDLTDRIHQYQYLCNQEQSRITTNRQVIQDHIAKLEDLDQRVEKLNATISYARSEKLKWMHHMLQETQHRSPMLREARAQHKRLVARIEGYCKNMNYAAHLAELQTKVDAARERQALWFCIQRWLPPTVIVLASLLLTLLISYF